MILDDSINHEKISNMTLPELKELCRELRRCILNTVSENGGHLASNLGTVELTAALHFVFDVKEDRIVWDVGHQAYAHKLLTGRYSEFSTLRSLNGISGFTRRKESTADAFISGHSSTSISAAFGIASAMRLQGAPRKRSCGDRRRSAHRRHGVRGSEQRRKEQGSAGGDT